MSEELTEPLSSLTAQMAAVGNQKFIVSVSLIAIQETAERAEGETSALSYEKTDFKAGYILR